MTESDFERSQEDAAAAEARGIGGRPSSEEPSIDADEVDPAQAPLIEAGEGESEGFELAEEELIEHASHGDEHSPWRIHEDASYAEEDPRQNDGAQADEEHTTEGPDEDR
ncbi:MAG: hypothetical protein QOF83_3026 [Solirubrobacteraceae bacterium]|jgi:hypothetical protein|nr:hypothetical protein [Solirubrobacteraceae bacterium]